MKKLGLLTIVPLFLFFIPSSASAESNFSEGLTADYPGYSVTQVGHRGGNRGFRGNRGYRGPRFNRGRSFYRGWRGPRFFNRGFRGPRYGGFYGGYGWGYGYRPRLNFNWLLPFWPLVNYSYNYPTYYRSYYGSGSAYPSPNYNGYYGVNNYSRGFTEGYNRGRDAARRDDYRRDDYRRDNDRRDDDRRDLELRDDRNHDNRNYDRQNYNPNARREYRGNYDFRTYHEKRADYLGDKKYDFRTWHEKRADMIAEVNSYQRN